MDNEKSEVIEVRIIKGAEIENAPEVTEEKKIPAKQEDAITPYLEVQESKAILEAITPSKEVQESKATPPKKEETEPPQSEEEKNTNNDADMKEAEDRLYKVKLVDETATSDTSGEVSKEPDKALKLGQKLVKIFREKKQILYQDENKGNHEGIYPESPVTKFKLCYLRTVTQPQWAQRWS